jgi:hypothetical protein
MIYNDLHIRVQRGARETELKKFRVVVSLMTDDEVVMTRGSVLAVDRQGALSMISLPPGAQIEIEGMPREQKCFTDMDFERLLNPKTSRAQLEGK